MTDKYEISQETFKSIFENVPHESRVKCLGELKGVIDSYISMIKDHGDIKFTDEVAKPMVFCDDDVDSRPMDFNDEDGNLVKTYGGTNP